MIAVSDVFAYQRAVRDRAPARLRLLLFILSTYHGPSGEIRPAASTIAEACGVTRRHVFRLLKEATAAGWILADRRPGLPSIYRLNVPPTIDPHVTGGVTPMSPVEVVGGDTHVTGGVTPMSPTSDPHVTGGVTPMSPKQHKNNTTTTQITVGASKVDKLRAKVAERWQVPIVVQEATLAAWLEPMESSEIHAALDDFDRRLQYANKCGSPMRKGRRPAVLAEVLEIHAKERPNKPALPDLTFAEEAPATPERKGDGGKAMLRAFFHAKGLTAPFDMKKEGTG